LISHGQQQREKQRQIVKELYLKLREENATEEIDKEVLSRLLNKKLVLSALVNLIIVRRLPFSMVEWPEFHEFCISLNRISPTVLPTSHITITNYIDKAFPEAQDTVRKGLQSVLTTIYLGVDVWTSPNYFLMLGISSSFVDSTGVFRNIMLGLRTTISQSGEL
jgi:hypothetical protein